MKFGNKGFTLIELLIVIALLGALAVGLLAALDPFEQLKKGTDTGTRNTVSEIEGAVIRYFAIRNAMPWPTGTAVSALSGGALYTTVVSPIVVVGELKSDFSSLAASQLNNIKLTGDDSTVTVCFKPLSKSIQSDPNTKFDQYGAPIADVAATCTPNIGSNAFDCYWCVK